MFDYINICDHKYRFFYCIILQKLNLIIMITGLNFMSYVQKLKYFSENSLFTMLHIKF